jgi:hypothetical protein
VQGCDHSASHVSHQDWHTVGGEDSEREAARASYDSVTGGPGAIMIHTDGMNDIAMDLGHAHEMELQECAAPSRRIFVHRRRIIAYPFGEIETCVRSDADSAGSRHEPVAESRCIPCGQDSGVERGR